MFAHGYFFSIEINFTEFLIYIYKSYNDKKYRFLQIYISYEPYHVNFINGNFTISYHKFLRLSSATNYL